MISNELAKGQMTKSIADKAEVALEYPDKFYSGTFERTSRFEAKFDPSGVALILERSGPPETKKSVHIHMHYGLFADVLEQLAATVAHIPKNIPSRDHLAEAIGSLQRALGGVDRVARAAVTLPFSEEAPNDN